ncbi:MAG: zinc ribbon domain-containing protein, partial [Acidobacteriota bacterium]
GEQIMHCPRCGQLQITEQTKFCSRCGFQLGLVGELLQNGGFLPQLADLHKGKSPIFSRKNGVIFSILWFIFWVMLMTSFFGLAGADPLVGISAVFGVFTTMMLLVISFAFLKRAPKAYELGAFQMPDPGPPASLQGNFSVGALPPQQSQPASTYMPPEGSWRAPDTGDLVRPGSVIEGTTKLLKNDQ